MITNYFANSTPEERARDRAEAIQKRLDYIQQAINDGAKINYVTSMISGEEQETHIFWNQSKDVATIDTTIRSDIIKIIKCGYKIVAVSQYQDVGSYENGFVCGIVAECPGNKISFRTM